MEATAMSYFTQGLENGEIQKAINRLGLTLSESEINDIKVGKHISLESRCLSEIGSLFILASAISANSLGKKMNHITFRDLPEAVHNSASCTGIPIYSWDSESLGKCSLYLTLVNGKPGISPCYGVCSNAI